MNSFSYAFSHTLRQTNEGQIIQLSGCLTERSDLSFLAGHAHGHLILDLGRIRRVNSSGVRLWLGTVRKLTEAGLTMEFRRCAPCIVRQLNMVSNFGGNATVRSVLAPYYCDACGHEKEVLVELKGDKPPPVAEELPCAKCGGKMEFDDLIETYFDFMERTNRPRGGRHQGESRP